MREIQQEGGEPLLRAHGSECQQYLVRTGDFLAHDPADLVLKRRNIPADLVNVLHSYYADFRVFHGDGRRTVQAFDHAVEPDDFAGQVKPGDLDLAALLLKLGLDRSEAKAKQRIQRFSVAVQNVALFQAHAFFD